jgi:hypothetical protein
MSKISNRASDKLRAMLNRDWSDRDRGFAPTYIDACATWFSGLTEGERSIADLALRIYLDGDEAGAQAIAARLPPAPKSPLID